MTPTSAEDQEDQLKEPEEIRRKVLEYRLRGQFIRGHEYISSLPDSLRRERKIAIESAQLYLVQGNYIRAAEACRLARKSIFLGDVGPNDFSQEILDVDSACLELLSAYIDITRLCSLNNALSTSQRVYDVWLKPTGRCAGLERGMRSLILSSCSSFESRPTKHSLQRNRSPALGFRRLQYDN